MAVTTQIKLNFINHSNDSNNSSFVVYQKNVKANLGELPVAWKTIQNCGQGDHHPFVYEMDLKVSAADSYGNYTPQFHAADGQLFGMKKTASGDQLVLVGTGSSVTEVQVANQLQVGSVNANIYRSGRLLATKTSVVPQQMAVFEFKPSIFIGAVSQVVEGSLMNSAIMSMVNTELSLLGIASADIVCTGGGAGPNSQPFTFTMQNIQMA